MSNPYHRIIHQNEQRFRVATEAAGIGVWELDMRAGVFHWNQPMYDLYGVPYGDAPLTFAAWEQRLLPEDRRAALERIWAAVEQGQPWETTFRIRRPDGSLRDIRSAGQQLYDEQGQPSRMFGINEDVTEQRQAERARARAEQEHRASLRAISHGLSKPLRTLGRAHERLRASALNAEQRYDLEQAEMAGETLLAQVHAILGLAQPEPDAGQLRAEPFDLRRCLSEQVALLRELAERKGLQLHLEWGGALPRRVRGDPVRFLQVVNNLTHNAIHFTEHGLVTVRVRRLEGARIEVAVADTGPGIAEADQARIFEAFTRACNSPTCETGCGFGLYICQQIVSLLGGEIQVESTPGAGAVFSFSAVLPEADNDGEASMVGDLLGDEVPSPGALELDVLVAEDDAASGRLLYELLLRIGCAPRLVDNGVDAFDEWQRRPPDLMLLDLHLPDLDGRRLTRLVRQAEAEEDMPRTPIAIITAHPLADVQRDCLQAGADRVFKERVGLGVLQQLIDHIRRLREQSTGCPV